MKPVRKFNLALFILYLSPSLYWAQEAQAKQSEALPPEGQKTDDWQLTNDHLLTFDSLNRRTTTTDSDEQVAASGLVQSAKYLYKAGHLLLAVKTWQQAAKAYRSQGDVLNEALTLSSLALAYQQLGQLQQAITVSDRSLKLVNNLETKPHSEAIAQILNNQGSLQLASGQADQALTSWQKAAKIYQSVGDRAGQTWSLLNSTQALQALGFYRRATSVLDSVRRNLQTTPDSPVKAVALRSLGNALRGVGDLGRSRKILEQSLAIAQQLGLGQEIDATLLSLANTARLQRDKKAAWKFLNLAASSTGFTATQAKLNQLSLLIEYKSIDAAIVLAAQLKPEISSLPESRASIYAAINFAQSIKTLQKISNNIPSQIEIAQLLAYKVEQAKSLKDARAEAFALGCLGSLYEQNQQWSEAKSLTEQALMLAQSMRSPDIDYRFSWQLGRILKAQGDFHGAIASYTQSTNALKSLRGDLVGVNPSFQFNFRDEVEPVYRQLADLLLLSKQPSQSNLVKARNAIEALQVAELNNFFQSACLDSKPIQVDSVIDYEDPQTAIVYPIILPDRLEIIVKLPNRPLQHYRANVSQSNLENILQHLRKNLLKPYVLQDTLLLSKQVYDWLLKPALPELTKSSIKTLVFVLDGSLRNIPIAALYDGQQYLIQKYAIALSPALNLLPPQPIEKIKLKALTAGLTEARSGFSPLSNVALEIGQIKSSVPSFVLLNREFTSTALQKEIESTSFPIVHLATHAQFSSEAAKTYILAWDKPIFVKDLDVLLRSNNSQQGAIELLILSGCQTAKGDNRAALGLAGVAVRAGARSTLATLWATYDDSSAIFMSEFYKQLAQNKLNKAQALRQAQLFLLNNPDYQLPVFWASYVMLGNWM